VPPGTNDYMTAVNILSFKRHVIRVTGTEFDASLYGRRREGRLDFTHYINQDSFDWGGGVAYQWNAFDQRFRRSQNGRFGYQLLRSNWKLSIGEDVTRHDYPSFFRVAHESVTTLLTEVGAWQLHLQYEKKRRYFLEDDKIHTGLARFGREVGRDKVLNAFYSASSLRGDLSDPEVWRAGGELVLDFY
jgi:hypothetical protein